MSVGRVLLREWDVTVYTRIISDLINQVQVLNPSVIFRPLQGLYGRVTLNIAATELEGRYITCK